MVKLPQKLPPNSNIPQNSPNQTSKLDSRLSKNKSTLKPKSQKDFTKSSLRIIKDKSLIDKDYYQKNKERKKQQRRERYQQQKLQAQLSIQEQSSKYSTASAYKVLMSFKEYTELNKEKKQLWLDFNWTTKDYQKSIEKEHVDVVMIMKLEQVVGKLVRDYWDTARSEEKQRSRSWNSLDYDEKQRLIRYWGYEKARVENEYLTEEKRLEKQGQQYEKEIELAKFHEERGKKGCKCYQCEQKKKIQGEIKQKWKKELEDYDRKSGISDKEECLGCGKLKVLGEESGVCRKCLEEYGS